MKIFQDVFTESEMLSDSYKMQEVFDGVGVQVKSRMVVKSEDNVDIGCGNAFGGEGKEEKDEGNQAPVQKVNDLIDAFGYQQANMDQQAIRAYAKKLLAWLKQKKPERADQFMEGAKKMFAFIKAKMEEITFYTPKNSDYETPIISWYKNESDDAPTFLYFLDGMKFYKV